MIDFTGNTLHKGDFIVYPRTEHRVIGLSYGIVLDTKVKTNENKIKILGARGFGVYEPFGNTIQKLIFPDRILFINNVPENVRKALDESYQIYWDTRS